MEPKVREWPGIWNDENTSAVTFELGDDLPERTTMFVSNGCICQVHYKFGRIDRFMLTEKQFRQIVHILREHGVEI
jgi:hypothetical protein